MSASEKHAVYTFWQEAACGEEAYARGDDLRARLDAQAAARYSLEPYIPAFARFDEGLDRDVCEIGVGMGADHLRWAQSRPRRIAGIDLTPRAVQLTRQRLGYSGLKSNLVVGDAENLPFPDATFDIVYSWGVLHHTPDTRAALREVVRVLRPGGQARLMLYHKHSIAGAMLWARYGLVTGRPWRSLDEIYAQHLESPGTKAYTRHEARAMLTGMSRVDVSVQLGFGDLLEGEAGQRHRGPLLSAARRLMPRALIRRWLPQWGILLLVDATK